MRRFVPAIAAFVLLAGTAFLIACGGGSSANLETLATQAADATPSASLGLSAKGLKFDKKTLVVPASQYVTIHLDNKDGGVLHNLSVYTDRSAKTKLFAGETFQGNATKDYSFTAPAAGVYYFRCDVHPDMNGAFIVK
jgi:plastocyanin